jgi:hypothetical protein
MEFKSFKELVELVKGKSNRVVVPGANNHEALSAIKMADEKGLISSGILIGDVALVKQTMKEVGLAEDSDSTSIKYVREMCRFFNVSEIQNIKAEFVFRFWNTSNVLEIKKIGDIIEGRLIYSAKNQDNKNDFFRKEFILPQNISQLIYENVNKGTFLKVPKDNLDLNLIGLDGRVYYYESKNWNQYSIKNYLTAMSYKDEGKSYIDFNNFLNSKINYENYYKQFENEIPYRQNTLNF